MPVCSARCRLLDLGNWASGESVIATIPIDSPERDPNDE
jgi:endogenous inhibitor of DNA gyrase (YacG/DUF329 family)